MYVELTQRVMKAANLEWTPVAIQLSTFPPPGVKKYEGPLLKACEMLDFARFEGEAVHTTVEDHDCANGLYYLGMTPPKEGLLDGRWSAGQYPNKGRGLYKSPVCRRRHLPYYSIIKPPGSIKYYSVSPMDKMPFHPEIGGVVVVFICNAKQALYLSRSLTYENGIPVDGMTGPATCSTIFVSPYLTGKACSSLGCFGARTFVKVKPEEVFLGVPLELFPQLVENLDSLLEGRPDLDSMLQEPVGTFHSASEDEREAQRIK